ncbi:MAG: competence type IV pilus major pilin ComGC [Candidatus Rifleibacteriota bacterium]
MKRFILVFCLFIFTMGPASAQAPWHENQIALITVNGTTFMNYILDKAATFGFHKNVIKEFEKVFRKNSGSDLRKDFHNVGMLIYQGKEGNPHIFGFTTGNFKPENWYGEFEVIAAQPLAAQHLKVDIRSENGKKIIDLTSKKKIKNKPAPVVSLFFESPNRAFFGPKEEINYASKLKFTEPPEAVKKQIHKQTFFINANLKALSKTITKAQNPSTQAVAPMIAPMSNLYVFYKDGKAFIRLDYVDEPSAKNFYDMLNGLITSYQQKLENDLAQIEEPSDGKGWLVNSLIYFGKKGSILSSKETIDSIKLVHENNVLMLKGTLPPLIRTGLIPVATVGILAAIAIPNFRKARGTARKTACFANQRVLLGATEMWNMDHPEMQTTLDKAFIEKLVEEGYLRSVPTCPAGGTYSSTGDLSTADGEITCSEHGPVR